MKTLSLILLVVTGAAFGQDWQFNTPTATNGCTISLGRFAEGWCNDMLGRQGEWNLGSGGSLALVGNVTPAMENIVTVKVTAWYDGWVFPAPSVALDGGTLLGTTTRTVGTYAWGCWVEYTSVWSVTPSGSVSSVGIWQPDLRRDTLVDAVTISAVVVPGRPPAHEEVKPAESMEEQ